MAPMSTSTVFIFLTLTSVLSSMVLAEDAADCIPKNLSGSEGNITLTYKKADESATCYLFHMSSVNSSLFLF
ncbi:hypothetical protein EB796_018911 [Bugula neritina]|uniref:Uncharacterized protein n=1 Tax=Bugula neritina TaxID=10212 RepID=A0A7J7JAX4_BUGNE|nr:hypothetical protein EB796_018911 [Bugula neritina]